MDNKAYIGLRLSRSEALYVEQLAERAGVTKTELIRNLIAKERQDDRDNKKLDHLIEMVMSLGTRHVNLQQEVRCIGTLLTALVRKAVKEQTDAEKMIKEAIEAAKRGG